MERNMMAAPLIEPASQSDAGDREERDYTPKTYSSRDNALFAAKISAWIGALVGLLWLLNKS